MLVYVLNKQGEPLMSCSPRKAKLLLRNGEAKVVRRKPFTIKLIYGSSGYKQPLTLGVDTGSGKLGAAVSDSTGNILYASEVEVRNDIADRMKQRAKYRRNRRNRKTRYRQARWLNRRNSIKNDRLSPTMTSKINSHLKEIKFVKSILPISKIILETGMFDPHALKNAAVLKNKWLYQKGINYGFANTKAFILNRDNYICQYCKGKSKDRRLEVHHIVFRSNNGSDEPENLITSCKTCHDLVHDGIIKSDRKGKKKGQLKYATQMNSIRKRLLRLLPEAEETFGFVTKEHRQLLNLLKTHFVDAAVIASEGKDIHFKTNVVLYKKCIPFRDYQQTKGVLSEQRIETGKIQGFRKFDEVRYNGQDYFIKGRMSTGYAILMDINGDKVNLKPIPKFSKMKRLQARTSWLVSEQHIVNILTEPHPLP